MAGPTRKQQNSNSTARPTFMKQLLFLVLPNSKQNQQEKQEQQNRIDNASSNGNSTNKPTSPFEKMYVSFPALEDDNTSTCGQQHHHSHHQHDRDNVVKTTQNGILC